MRNSTEFDCGSECSKRSGTFKVFAAFVPPWQGVAGIQVLVKKYYGVLAGCI